MSKKLKLTVNTNLAHIDEESAKTPDFMRRSDLGELSITVKFTNLYKT